MSLKSLLIHTVDVQQKTVTTGAAGGRVNAWSVRKAGVKCRIQPASTGDSIYIDNQRITHVVYFDADHGIAASDRLAFGTRKLDVIGVSDTDELDRLWKAMCIERSDLPAAS